MADSDTRTITVAERSPGHGGTGDVGRPVSLPVVELLTGRGFITGKSGSGKSNSASVVAEKLLDNGFGLLIVDIDGEYYGLKEEYEILHAGADDECDIQVTTDHAEKLASLALEQNVPIILDVSSYLDEEKAREVLTAVARQLFAKAKKCKQPFLLLVEEIHEYIPEKGGVDECGKMLIKIGKRGRKHGLGIVGISQRPADVKKDFITQCDWLVWHRLTWNNDTKVVSRILDGQYADAVEDLADGEAFLMTDWAEAVERVQFYRKQTFDAGATPGLEDFERPDLKSVSDDLVSELKSITDERAETEDRIAELREELDRKNSRIAELERELQDARDMSRMADQFVDALVEHVDGANPGRTEQAKLRDSHARTQGQATDDTDDQATFGSDVATADGSGTAAPDAAGGNGTGEAVAEAFESIDDFVPAEASVDSTPIADATDTASETDESADGTGSAGEDEDEITAASGEVSIDEVPDFVGRLRAEVRSLEPKTQKMLSYYREQGPASPLDAHFVAGGSGDRTHAYARNRTLRTAELIEHVGQGAYDYRLPDLLADRAERAPEDVEDTDLDAYIDVIEATIDDF
ncbi:DUF87 domain-containing protein [Halorhabdus sp. BNX81]|uniref:helicase HerA domain-containing protein n=1 Tax=Halorhabdus sp. BNX81 TaxID=2980181 RepID=UPI0023DD1912|nr:DUF87 domain-containing protein [Halorhabdus sp. BNX81]WEL21843.1 DUF87 domain-containing protein [Halorhabdus sp. BNX81]